MDITETPKSLGQTWTFTTLHPQQDEDKRGNLVAATVEGNHVLLWFQSPTGDSSDVQIATLVCHNNEQAIEIKDRHCQLWNLSPDLA